MLAKTKTCAVVGLDGHVVEVEVDISPGLPAFNIVGLPDDVERRNRGNGSAPRYATLELSSRCGGSP